MKIRVEVEPNDLVRAAQARHVSLHYKEAEKLLRREEQLVKTYLEEAKKNAMHTITKYLEEF